MAEPFMQLSAKDRRDALEVAAGASGRPVHLLEKDIWVVWALEILFASAHAPHLVFKGGTSLSKAYGAIRRFSEDIDLTYDIRAIAADLVAKAPEALPPNPSQEKKWTKEIRARLSRWALDDALPTVASALTEAKLPGKARAEGDTVYIDYEPLAAGTGYVQPMVRLEFGARSTGEPWETRAIVCDAAEHLPQLTFPTAAPRVMRITRTFWEKATAIHVFCLQGRFRGAERFARHWHDVARLADAGHAADAIADRDVAGAVARHKAVFFIEKDTKGTVIDYGAAVAGHLRLVPDGDALALLAEDYRRMVEDGLLLDDAEPFEALIDRCRQIEAMANNQAGPQTSE
jgi:Nucleotidyl transferase AbiEii toxin, Type IV TA system